MVSNCTFDGTGNPMTLGQTRLAPTTIFVAGNRALNPVATLDNSGKVRLPYFATLAGHDSLLYARNVLTGAWGAPYVGEPLSATHVIDGNDYSGARFVEPWFAIDTTKGEYVSEAAWRAQMDGASKWPTTQAVGP